MCNTEITKTLVSVQLIILKSLYIESLAVTIYHYIR